jgi:hypothetical protein
MIEVKLSTTNLIGNSVKVGIRINNHESIINFPIQNLSDENHRKLVAILNDHLNAMNLDELATVLGNI